jgi:hypothetical protein
MKLFEFEFAPKVRAYWFLVPAANKNRQQARPLMPIDCHAFGQHNRLRIGAIIFDRNERATL